MHGKLKTARPRASLRQGRNDWYRISNLGGSAEVVIYDEIGYWGVTAEDFMAELRSLDVGEITLRVNSPGGEIFDGIAIHNLLRSHRAQVTTYVDSLAASIASVIALAGDRVIMQPHSQMMIHDGSGLAIGNASDMREMADLLDRQSDNIAEVYAERAGGTAAEWRDRMREETWYSAAEAVAAGLADEVAQTRQRPEEGEPTEPAPNMAASWDLSIFRYAGREEAPAPTAAADGPAPENPVREGEPTPGQPPAAEPAPEPGDEPQPERREPAEEPAEPGTAEDTEEPEPEPADDWAALTAHFQHDDADDWSALVSHLTHPASPAATDA
ncbi:head maturation protease, ClpP-related [Streptomyces cucumeris]|uniref:head maturation protease, ClpP-related n=1 Tax=Streptomyces cucumeris TaxID=2962890 RepID=UPI003D706182